MEYGTYFAGSDTILVFKFFYDVFVEGTLLAMPIAGLSPLAGLLDYEDTRLKTSSRVRMGLYLAWKES